MGWWQRTTAQSEEVQVACCLVYEPREDGSGNRQAGRGGVCGNAGPVPDCCSEEIDSLINLSTVLSKFRPSLMVMSSRS